MFDSDEAYDHPPEPYRVTLITSGAPGSETLFAFYGFDEYLNTVLEQIITTPAIARTQRTYTGTPEGVQVRVVHMMNGIEEYLYHEGRSGTRMLPDLLVASNPDIEQSNRLVSWALINDVSYFAVQGEDVYASVHHGRIRA